MSRNLSEVEKRERDLEEHLMKLPHDRLVALTMTYMWERDIAIAQLEELGYSLGQVIGKKDKRGVREGAA